MEQRVSTVLDKKQLSELMELLKVCAVRQLQCTSWYHLRTCALVPLQEEAVPVGQTSAAIEKSFPGHARMRAGYAISFLLQDNLLTRAQVRSWWRFSSAQTSNTPSSHPLATAPGRLLRARGLVPVQCLWHEPILLCLHRVPGAGHVRL